MDQSKRIVFSTTGIYKSFESTKALIDVSMDLREGEVLGLIGENGSGKSTLSSIIAGIQRADKGAMWLDGEEYKPVSITDAMNHGISIIVQEQGTLNGISVAANIFAGKEHLFSKYGLLNMSRMYKETSELLEAIGVAHIKPDILVDQISFEERKLLEVARAEFNKPRILLIDETTTALGKEGRGVMYAMINRMRDEGKSVIFISHDIGELLQVCDRVTVLRDGVLVGDLEGEDMRADSMKKMMVGRDVPENMYRTDYGENDCGNVALEGKNISYSLLNDISIKLHTGEILGIGGLTDCGMHELGMVLFGLIEPDVGTVYAHGDKKIQNAMSATKEGMGYVSKNRDTEALMAMGSIKDNMCLPILNILTKHGLISPRKEAAVVDVWSKTLNIKMRDSDQYVIQLSGGNKQKVSISKWLASNADILIFDCPTRGIDIGVKKDIYDLLYSLKKEGKAILMISEELPELIGMSDRILILKNGQVSSEFARDVNISENELIDYMI
jgi:ribose transport system ATP-binding protein